MGDELAVYFPSKYFAGMKISTTPWSSSYYIIFAGLVKFNKNSSMAGDFKLASHCTVEFLKGKDLVSSYLTWRSRQSIWHVLYNQKFLTKLVYAKFTQNLHYDKVEKKAGNLILF